MDEKSPEESREELEEEKEFALGEEQGVIDD